MLHQNSVFHGLLKHVPWHRFDRLVEDHGADARVRRLSTKSQLIALLYGQLSGAASLREIVTGLSSHSMRLYHVGADPVRRSTFSDANAQRPVAVFTDLLAMMMKQAHRGLRRKMAETTYLIDATSARLNERSAGWARFSAGVCGAKVHVIYDADADRPIYASVTAARVNDITAARQMPIEPGATYVFDLGYYDYDWWAALDADGFCLSALRPTAAAVSPGTPGTLPGGDDDAAPDFADGDFRVRVRLVFDGGPAAGVVV